MSGITRYVLKRPITTIMCILCLIFFGYSSVTGAKLELTPEMDMPMMLVMTIYSGASPEDVDELITKEIEDQISSLSGIKSITSRSNEGSSVVMVEYEYGTDTDEAYDDLKKKIDLVEKDLPEDADTPLILEMDMNAMPDITLSIDNREEENLYSYVNDKIVPEFEKISVVADVTIRGGAEKYVKIELIPEKVSQYKLSMSSIASDIAAADLSYPAGDTQVGSLELSVSTRQTYDTVELLKEIPLTTQDGSSVYLQDVANVYTTEEDSDSIARYNGENTISVSITKQQSSTAIELSKEVQKVIDNLTKETKSLNIVMVNDNADSIISSLSSVVETLLMAIGISMVIIWLFFGDIKASLIVGSSIPVSILAALILMSLMDFSLNVITMSALTLGVGMMVDNSIVVLESCFRVTASRRGGFVEYMENALEGTNIVAASILGGTATTCVVFIPLAFLEGMTGQLFKPLGFTIVFCMVASLVSAITVVPLCYMMYRPVEREKAPFSRPVVHLQDIYRKLMKTVLRKKKTVMGVSVGLLVLALFIGTKLQVELMASDDQGEISISVDVRPGLITESVDTVLQEIEAVIVQHPDLEAYMTTYGGESMSGSDAATITAYLKDDRNMSTGEVINQWKKDLSDIKNCNISVDMNSSMSMMSSFGESYEVLLKSTDYDELKEVSSAIVDELKGRDDVTKVHSDLENSAPVVEVRVDALKAQSVGLSATQVGRAVNNIISGVEATEIEIDGEDVTVNVEYADDEYKTIDQVKGIVLSTGKGGSVALTDLADVKFVDSPATVNREDRQYLVTITAEYTEKASMETEEKIRQEVINPHLTSTVSIGLNSTDQSMNEEFAALFGAIGTAVFLIFVVMAAQFESPKFSFMVMTTIPFSLIGAFGLLWLTDCKISMISLIGFLMLIGTVVNNGILYVDTVNQYRREMEMDTALIEAGATRIRPILMTTLTTVLSMIPMALALGNAGSMTQGLAVVNIGGLTASTVLALLMLPVYYKLMSGGGKKKKNRSDA
ncbi:MAG: efflux RND transporter permease subunit [Enterocloster sp.]